MVWGGKTESRPGCSGVVRQLHLDHGFMDPDYVRGIIELAAQGRGLKRP